jgi:hypothetical protein
MKARLLVIFTSLPEVGGHTTTMRRKLFRLQAAGMVPGSPLLKQGHNMLTKATEPLR